jgi:hypothetical protein
MIVTCIWPPLTDRELLPQVAAGILGLGGINLWTTVC